MVRLENGHVPTLRRIAAPLSPSRFTSPLSPSRTSSVRPLRRPHSLAAPMTSARADMTAASWSRRRNEIPVLTRTHAQRCLPIARLSVRSTAHIPNACPVPASPTPRRIAAINEEIYFTAITVAHLVRLSAPPPTPWQRRRRGRGRGGGVASREQNPRDDSHAHQCLPIPPPTSPTPTTRHKSVVMTANAIPAAHLRAPLAPAPMIRVQVYAVHILLIQFLATGESALGSRTSTPPPLLPAPMCRTAADQTIDHDPLLVG
ncbi:hypothetical protein K438DRAFT_1991455 [Mycena galopus ATCC 62051]|nr:hypothetical protein K438DRAFT_1991455 [Mycena galopus ATCC 62051]